ncbi:hypothetical protein GCM10009837_07280 [Streptomyces durmitorensis]
MMDKYTTDTGSEVEVEDDGDFTVTFSMQLTKPADDNDES